MNNPGILFARPSTLIARCKWGTIFAEKRWKYSRMYHTAFSGSTPSALSASYTAMPG